MGRDFQVESERGEDVDTSRLGDSSDSYRYSKIPLHLGTHSKFWIRVSVCVVESCSTSALLYSALHPALLV